MMRSKSYLRFLIPFILLVMGLAIVAHNSINAALRGEESYITYVEIDGVNYGPIDRIEGIEQFAGDGFPLREDVSFEAVRLSREFVTDPSLYLWAKKRMSRKLGLKDIHLITEDERGQVVTHQILQLCQPLSWTVEAQNPSLGGFNETIDLAVQKVTSL
ncbi:MAG: hypothetical protein ACOH5I_16155 [Oligoflexus sp.]